MIQNQLRQNKKAIVTGISIAMVCVFLITGIADAAKVRQMSMGSAGSKGWWYMINSVFAKIISTNVPNVRLTAVISPGASTENAKRIHAREMEMGGSTSSSTYMAYHGLDVFAPIKQDVLSWFYLTENAYMMVVREDSDIKSINDLKGKKLSIDKKGTTGYNLTIDILNLHGIKPGDFKEYNQSRGEGSRALIDGRVDCWFYSTALNLNPHVTRIMAARKVRFISMDKEKIKPFLDKHPYYKLVNQEVIRGQKQENPVYWIQYVQNTMIGKYLDEQFVYDCTKAIFDNIDQVHAASPKYKGINLQTALTGLNVPVHPGAMRYFKEKGVPGCDDPKLQYKP